MQSARALLGLATVLVLPAPAWAADTDGDGVADGADVFPCDATSAGEAFSPARGAFGMLMMEDRFPAGGDYDFNDVVIGYNYMARTNAAGQVVALRLNLRVLAAGGNEHNGLGVHLPVPATAIAHVTRTIGTGSAQTLTRAADTELTVTVLDDVRDALGGVRGPTNSIPTLARVDSAAVQIDIAFATPQTLAMGSAPFDLYAFRVNTPSLEIHLPRYSGTRAMNRWLFGTGDDASTEGRWFVDTRGVPFALVMPSVVAYPLEDLDITDLYPNILGFAASGGTTQQNFYATSVITSAAYADDQGRGVATPTLAADRYPTTDACVPRYQPGTQGYAFTGAVQTFVVPEAVTAITVVARGAAGGTVDSIRQGGPGGQVTATLPVTPGETLYLHVGGMGGRPTAGWNGGAYSAGAGTSFVGGAGGGASDIRRGAALSTRVIVAGGGGGGGVGPGSRQHGGAGGGLIGAAGQTTSSSAVGSGGSQTAGGSGGTSGYNGALGPYPGSAGSLGNGGMGGSFTGSTPRGGGGGGGYHGGGGGGVYYCCGAGGAGGGGGSSYTASGASNVSHVQGGNPTHGSISITW